MARGPVIRHTNKNAETRAAKKIVTLFSNEVIKLAIDMISSGKLNEADLAVNENKEITGEHLLNVRKKLAAAIKSGMLEKKDKEPEIALYAAIIWFLRLEKPRRKYILSEWGIS